MNKTIACLIAVASVAFAGVTSPALAADIQAPAVGDWSGFYMGLNAGAAMSSGDLTSKTNFASDGYFAASSVPAVNKAGKQNFDETDFTGGAQIGFNYQHDMLVLGLEGDFNYLGLDASESGSGLYPCCSPTGFNVKQDLSVDWLSTVRARLGLAQGQFLLYGTGGIAFGDVNYDTHFKDTFTPYNFDGGSADEVKLGWTAGGGVEWMMHDNLSLKLEYLYYDLGSVSAQRSFPGYSSTKLRSDADVSGSIVRVGVNWHIN